MKCPNCGHDLTQTNKGVMCFNCGYAATGDATPTTPPTPADATIGQPAQAMHAAPTAPVAQAVPTPPPAVPPTPVPPLPPVAPTPGQAPVAKAESWISRHKFKFIIAIIALLVLAAGAYVYFQYLPNKYAKAYTDSMKSPSADLKASVDKTIGSYGRPVYTTDFTKADDSVLGKDISDLQYASSALNATQTSLATFNKDNSSLKILPGTGWTKAVKDAKATQKTYQEYAGSVDKFVTDYRGVNDYLTTFVSDYKKFADLADKTFNGPACKTTAECVARFDAATAAMDSFTGGLRKITPPSYLADFHNAVIKDFDAVTQAFRDMEKGAKDQNPSELFGGIFELEAPSKDLNKQDFVKIIKTKSPIPGEINDLQGSSLLTT